MAKPESRELYYFVEDALDYGFEDEFGNEMEDVNPVKTYPIRAKLLRTEEEARQYIAAGLGDKHVFVEDAEDALDYGFEDEFGNEMEDVPGREASGVAREMARDCQRGGGVPPTAMPGTVEGGISWD